jgi:alkaline phosphatase D
MMTRKQFIARLLAACAWLSTGARAGDAKPNRVYMANGIKTGEVTSHSAILWGRLTAVPDMTSVGLQFRDDDGVGGKRLDLLSQMVGSVPGLDGEMRVKYWPEQRPDHQLSTEWADVDGATDNTHQFGLRNLEPATAYRVRVEGRLTDSNDAEATTVEGQFRTAPEVDAETPVSFAVITCQDYHRRDDARNGHTVYSTMGKLGLDFIVHTGDQEYYDIPKPFATTVESARFKWRRIYAEPFLREFHRSNVTYFLKDDHDVLRDDCWPGQRFGDLTFAQGLAIHREQVPSGPLPYRTVRWGRDVELWLMEGREFRTPNTVPDGPDKSIWGSAQKQWFYDTFNNSDATFRVLVSPTPLVGPDKPGKADNHANDVFKHEGDELRAFLAAQKNTIVICGDRHWQYVSVDPDTGLREYSVGPTSDLHAGLFSDDQRTGMHKYLRICGGFFHVEVFKERGASKIALRHCGVDGNVNHEEIVEAV